MGLLTNPNAGQGKLIKLLIKHYSKLCALLYIGSIIWFCALAHNSVSLQIYISENALLPGLVKSNFNEVNAAKIYYNQLLAEMETYKDTVPYPWLLAKFRQIGLDAYSHNFSLNHPIGKPQKFVGKNVYGILRAPRAASTESVVLSVPYRPPSSIHPTTAPSIALMLAFAKFASRENYWAKDIIFLITEHEQLGIQAWLEAYHSVSCGKKDTLEHGDLRGRAGAIQAAINLEFHDIDTNRVDVKIEGLNGHLPNLDLVTLVNKMCSKEGIFNTFKNRGFFRSNNPYSQWKYSFLTMISMIATQSTGVPNGNHGLFHRFGIEAVTMEGFASQKYKNGDNLLSLGRVLEAIFRSLNNLLERFHQSYFFYLLPSSDRFVSIGLYFPVIICLAGMLFIKSCAYWYRLNDKNDLFRVPKEKETDSSEKLIEKNSSENSNKEENTLVGVSYIILLSHSFGILFMNSPKIFAKIGSQYPTDDAVFVAYSLLFVVLLILPYITRKIYSNINLDVLNIFCNLEMGTTLIAVGMMNFSLSLFCGIIYAPILLLMSPIKKGFKSKVQKLLWILVHPLVAMYIIVTICTYYSFPNESLKDIFIRSFDASSHALMFSIVDSLIYGNWLYKLATCVFLPNWICTWHVLFPNNKEITLQKKND